MQGYAYPVPKYFHLGLPPVTPSATIPAAASTRSIAAAAAAAGRHCASRPPSVALRREHRVFNDRCVHRGSDVIRELDARDGVGQVEGHQDGILGREVTEYLGSTAI